MFVVKQHKSSFNLQITDTVKKIVKIKENCCNEYFKTKKRQNFPEGL